jgi:hypothetical protein
MYCIHCGGKFSDDNALICTACGRKSIIPRKWGIASVIGIIIGSMFIPLLGIIFGIYGMSKEEKKSQGTFIFIFSIIMFLFHVFINIHCKYL